MTKAILLGMNSPRTDRCLEYDSFGAGKNLFDISAMSSEEYEASFDRMNLVKTTEWSDEVAKMNAVTLMEQFVRERRVVVVLGNKVWECLGLPDVDWMRSCSFNKATFYCVPHTSGRNLYYNHPINRRKHKRLLQRISREVLCPTAAS